ncbi:MAG: hypothetical protein JWM11_1301 [Planctomycetaceae bacterium]|nr:hypothetical protein [Planctomycetaceae bacterium]
MLSLAAVELGMFENVRSRSRIVIRSNRFTVKMQLSFCQSVATGRRSFRCGDNNLSGDNKHGVPVKHHCVIAVNPCIPGVRSTLTRHPWHRTV